MNCSAAPEPRPLRTLGLVIHSGRPPAQALARFVVSWAATHGISVRALRAECGVLEVDVAQVSAEEFAPGLDLVVVLGGDGTILRAFGLVLAWDIPVLGVNLGRLGFLAEVEPHDMMAALDAARVGRYEVESRATVAATLLVDGLVPVACAGVNDVVVEKVTRERTASLLVTVDGRLLARYSADGLILATATGSTAYSFSAAGPIVSPLLDALLLTPVAAHMVFNRTLVLAPSETVRIEVLGTTSVQVSVDGRALQEVPPGGVIEVRRGPHCARLVRVAPPDFYGLVRSKFRLADAGEADPSRFS